MEYKKNLRHPLFKPEISNPQLLISLLSYLFSGNGNSEKRGERRENREENKRSGNFLTKIATSFEDSDQLSYQTHTLMTFC